MRIVFLGASLTEGSYGGSYVQTVAARLPGHTIINRGVNGSTINKLLERLESVLRDDAPDALFVLAGTNDAIAYSQPATRPYYRSAQGLQPDGYLTPDAYGAAFRDLLTQTQLAHVQPLVGLPPIELNARLMAASQTFNTQAREVAHAFNVPVLDLAALFNPPPDGLPDRPDLDLKTVMLIGERVKTGWSDYDAEQQRGGFTYTFDGLHPTPAGAAQIGAAVADFIAAQLQR